jgi:uncharacterized membrane protein YwzB
LYRVLLFSSIADPGYFEENEYDDVMKAVMSIQIMVCIIIILNLLISIVGNVFEDVNEKSAAYD